MDDGRRSGRIMEPDAVDTRDYSREMWERRNLTMMVVMYLGCCIILAGVMCL